MTGPLAGLTVVELGGIGPGPFCAMLLADSGADVIRIHRPGDAGRAPNPVLDRGRRCIAVDLKSPNGIAVVRRLLDRADAMIEGFRPGVLERLGLAPDVLRSTNPRLVVGRMTGFGQTGPLAARAGHDINYIAQAGVLNSIGRPDDKPVPPLNLVGDFGGGGMLLAFGLLAALHSARETGAGQDVDAAMVDGAALLMAMTWGFAAEGRWSPTERGVNLFDGSVPYYDTYECADGKYVAVGAIEPAFFRALVEGLGLADRIDPARQTDAATFEQTRKLFSGAFATRTRDEWVAHFDGVDACLTPVLSMAEATRDAHLRDRGTFMTVDGVVHPAPAPRFSATATASPAAPASAGAHTDAILAGLGFGPAEVAALREEGTVA
ncbi:CaiB/BaiF CoA transferase family protein [Amycolatopsis echigonensis]|uniref:CoA transferase n=1 Tax=Amycolatopsis echigonensis TaxID=2576905 RepID=A0A8E1VYI9_9PSEU|nr:CaiB/BaiF CoA-transferase family protein [Amycolatopsis echigonensis]MBB2500517.1 CoA transferase [Amycolatopsis echigonensis]